MREKELFNSFFFTWKNERSHTIDMARCKKKPSWLTIQCCLF